MEDCEQNLTKNLSGSRQNECKLSKKQRRVVQKQLKLRNTLARHENIICSDIATMVCAPIVSIPLSFSVIVTSLNLKKLH